ncbi:MAG: hypothetical protein AB1Z98_17115 [Nannocystaceae bacterium]
MSAKSTVDQLVVTPATVLANVDAGVYVTQQTQILSAAATAAAAQIAQGLPQGVIVAALVPVLLAQATAFPAQVLPATLVAQAAFA